MVLCVNAIALQQRGLIQTINELCFILFAGPSTLNPIKRPIGSISDFLNKSLEIEMDRSLPK